MGPYSVCSLIFFEYPPSAQGQRFPAATEPESTGGMHGHPLAKAVGSRLAFVVGLRGERNAHGVQRELMVLFDPNSTEARRIIS